MAYSEKTWSVSASQKNPGKYDVAANWVGEGGVKCMVKIEERKDSDREVACGLNYATKSGWKLDVKSHPQRVLEDKKDKGDLKAAVYAPLVKGEASLNVAAELKGNVKSIVNSQYQVALAGSTKGMIGGLYYRSQDGGTAGANF